MQDILRLEHIQKFYGKKGHVTQALQDVSFTMEAGEFTALMGASGSGKTTLLNCIATIDTASAGHIYLDGQEVTEMVEKAAARFRRENLGFIFQDFQLLDTLTVAENIALALSINGISPEQIAERVQKAARRLQIGDILARYPYQISGGQKQRCACARAIVNRPKLILADEPTGALDSHASQKLLGILQELNRELGATILLVTHDAYAASYAGRVLFLRDGQIFTELRCGQDSRQAFLQQILDVQAVLGGGWADED